MAGVARGQGVPEQNQETDMSTNEPSGAATPQQRTTTYNEPSGAAIGWSAFAAFMLMMLGIFQALAGIAAIANDDLFAVTQDYVIKLDTDQWGWVHLIIGILVFLAGLGIFSGNVLAR